MGQDTPPDQPYTPESTAALADDAEVVTQIEGTTPVVEEAVVAPEAEAVAEEVVAEEPVVTPDYQSEIEALKAKIGDMEAANDRTPDDLSDALGYGTAEPFAPNPETQGSDLPDFGDMYDEENYKKNVANYITEQAKLSQEQVFSDPKFKALENTLYMREHERAVEAATAQFGETFNYEKNGSAILGAQQKLPGLTIADAHRALDYDRLMEENRKLREGSAARASTKAPTSNGAATRFVDNTDSKNTVTLTAVQKAAADKYMNGDYAKYASGLARTKGTSQ